MKRKIAAVLSAVCVILSLFWGLSTYAKEAEGVNLPVLMYHHFDTEISSDTVVSGERFREQIAALKEAGYTSITLAQMLDFVGNGVPLPEKPVLITMDDGYTSNLEIAAPILEESGMCATVFVIGINEGEALYAHSRQPLLPARFSYEDAAPWVEKGVLDLQSHSMDMHQLESYGYSGRDGMLPLQDESDEAYRRSIKEDAYLFRQRRKGRVSTELTALAYPFGYYSQETDALLAEEGILITFTTDEHCNRLYTGDSRSLRMLGRYPVTERTTGGALADFLDHAG